ncbi:MAG: serine hydrolase domain-containing protein [Bacteroidota bacterium]
MAKQTTAKQNVLLVLFFLFTINLFPQSTSEIDSEAITKILYQYADDEEPGMAVGVVKDGKIVYEYYMGYADLTHQVKVFEGTRFNIASNAKQFTALCVLKLAQEGKIKLDDDIRKYFPELYKNIEDKITISNLITHTSGIRDYCDLMALTGKTWWKQFIDNGDAIELLEGQQTLNFRVGTEYLYSNSNYILLAELVKKVADQDFNDFAIALFEALDMPSTGFFTHYGAIIPNRARPYGNWGVWREEPTITEVHGDGALFTTLRDQLQWEQIVQANNGKYLPQELINESQSTLESSIEDGYGYGLFFDKFNELDYVFHDGVTAAYNNTFLRFPSKDLSIVVMTNNRNVIANNIAWQIAGIALELSTDNTRYPAGPEKIESLRKLQDVVGSYQNNAGTIIKITEKDGFLYRDLYQREPVKLLPEQGGLFEYETIEGLKMHFSNIGQTKQQLTIYRATQVPNTFYRLYLSDLTKFDKNELNGRFYNQETDTEIILKFVEGTTYSLIKNGREREAQLIIEDYIRMMSDYKIRILRDKNGKVVGLNVENNRIKNVIFERT